jgi:hypothetical protein
MQGEVQEMLQLRGGAEGRNFSCSLSDNHDINGTCLATYIHPHEALIPTLGEFRLSLIVC